jgi:hypothetical protein
VFGTQFWFLDLDFIIILLLLFFFSSFFPHHPRTPSLYFYFLFFLSFFFPPPTYPPPSLSFYFSPTRHIPPLPFLSFSSSLSDRCWCTAKERYRVLLSDTVSSQHVMLAAQLNHRVTSGRVIDLFDLQFLEIELSNLVHLVPLSLIAFRYPFPLCY